MEDLTIETQLNLNLQKQKENYIRQKNILKRLKEEIHISNYEVRPSFSIEEKVQKEENKIQPINYQKEYDALRYKYESMEQSFNEIKEKFEIERKSKKIYENQQNYEKTQLQNEIRQFEKLYKNLEKKYKEANEKSKELEKEKTVNERKWKEMERLKQKLEYQLSIKKEKEREKNELYEKEIEVLEHKINECQQLMIEEEANRKKTYERMKEKEVDAYIKSQEEWERKENEWHSKEREWQLKAEEWDKERQEKLTYQSAIEDTMKRIEIEIQKEKEDYKRILQEKEISNQRLTEKNEELSKEIERLETENKEVQRKNEDIEKKRERKQWQLEKEIISYQTVTEKQKKEIEYYKGMMQRIEKLYKEEETKGCEKEATIKTYEQEKQNIQQQLSETYGIEIKKETTVQAMFALYEEMIEHWKAEIIVENKEIVKQLKEKYSEELSKNKRVIEKKRKENDELYEIIHTYKTQTILLNQTENEKVQMIQCIQWLLTILSPFITTAKKTIENYELYYFYSQLCYIDPLRHSPKRCRLRTYSRVIVATLRWQKLKRSEAYYWEKLSNGRFICILRSMPTEELVKEMIELKQWNIKAIETICYRIFPSKVQMREPRRHPTTIYYDIKKKMDRLKSSFNEKQIQIEEYQQEIIQIKSTKEEIQNKLTEEEKMTETMKKMIEEYEKLEEIVMLLEKQSSDEKEIMENLREEKEMISNKVDEQECLIKKHQTKEATLKKELNALYDEMERHKEKEKKQLEKYQNEMKEYQTKLMEYEDEKNQIYDYYQREKEKNRIILQKKQREGIV